MILENFGKILKIPVHWEHISKKMANVFKLNLKVCVGLDIIHMISFLSNGYVEQFFDSGGNMKDVLTEFCDDFSEQYETGSSMSPQRLRIF